VAECVLYLGLKFIRGHDITRTLVTFEALYRGEHVVDPDPELTDD
jgi:hypothetical protein